MARVDHNITLPYMTHEANDTITLNDATLRRSYVKNYRGIVMPSFIYHIYDI